MKTIQDHITKLDREYDTLNEEMAKGENAKFGPEPMSQTHTKKSIPYHTDLCSCNFILSFSSIPSHFILLRWWKVAHKKMNDATFVFETQGSELQAVSSISLWLKVIM